MTIRENVERRRAVTKRTFAFSLVVLLVGCREHSTAPEAIAGTWQPVEAVPVAVQWYASTLTALPGGRAVLIGAEANPRFDGGRAEDEPLAVHVFLYDGRTRRWSAGAPMHVPRAGHSAVALDDGRVVVSGGSTCPYPNRSPRCLTDATEIFDARTNTWKLSTPMPTPRARAGAVRLAGGLVMFGPGVRPMDGYEEPVERIELFDPSTETWTEPRAPKLQWRSQPHWVSAPLTGLVVAGGTGECSGGLSIFGGPVSTCAPLVTAEIVSASRSWALKTGVVLPGAAVNVSGEELFIAGGTPSSGKSISDVRAVHLRRDATRAVAPMLDARDGFTLTAFREGYILASGGTLTRPSAEVLDVRANRWRRTAPPSRRRLGHRAVAMDDGTVLVVGGALDGPYDDTSAEVFTPQPLP